MPIYEYQCTSCEHCFEQKQGFDADPISIKALLLLKAMLA
ncbi:MAG: FmdB family zinc ribbon protein [Dehalococcoidia bacterium]